jgi:hypothetical protein
MNENPWDYDRKLRARHLRNMPQPSRISSAGVIFKYIYIVSTLKCVFTIGPQRRRKTTPASETFDGQSLRTIIDGINAQMFKRVGLLINSSTEPPNIRRTISNLRFHTHV